MATQSLRQENQLHFIEFDDENNIIDKTVYAHPAGEVWNLSSSYNDKQIFSSCYHSFESGKVTQGCAIWRLPSSDDSTGAKSSPTSQPGDTAHSQLGALEQVSTVDSQDFGDISTAHWKPVEGESVLMAIAHNNMLLFNVELSRPELVSSLSVPNRKGHPCTITKGTWNPHHGGRQFAVAVDQNVLGWDIRSKEQAFQIENAHGQLVRDIDFNPNKMYYVVTCGDDCQVKFWDVRDSTEPVKVLMDDHSHWVWAARYNPFHDQLVLSGGSDSNVILYGMSSISSEPDGHEALSDDSSESSSDEDSPKKVLAEDGIISVYEEHEDSVYAVEWSAADPWTFASLSYDGRFVINRVPKKIKYGILL